MPNTQTQLPEEKLTHLKRSLDNLDPIFDSLEDKYGKDGAVRILKTQMMIHLIGTDKSKEEILKLADKVAIFNSVKPLKD